MSQRWGWVGEELDDGASSPLSFQSLGNTVNLIRCAAFHPHAPSLPPQPPDACRPPWTAAPSHLLALSFLAPRPSARPRPSTPTQFAPRSLRVLHILTAAPAASDIRRQRSRPIDGPLRSRTVMGRARHC